MTHEFDYDIIIVGAGPIGLACAIEAKSKGFKHLVIEKGCLVNSLYNYPTNMTFFSTSERLEIGDVPFISHGVKPTRTEALEYYRRVKDSWQLNVKTYEEVESISNSGEIFVIKTVKAEYTSKYAIISTGFFDYPNLMNIPGEELPKVRHYYTEPHPYAYQNIVVIGGGNSAVDVALETYRRGANVTLVIRDDKLEKNVKYWVRPDIENRIKEGEIKAYFNSTVKEIKPNEIVIETPEGIKIIKNDFVLAMTGYHPDFDFLESTGIALSNDNEKIPIFDPETYESNVAKLFLAGVVCGGMKTGAWFIENARIHAPKIFDRIKQYERESN
ncbi:MAG: YpdA family putative bacillithiol disulfide reductase [Melioribacteraceae bacterium]|nr:YpdA family putative bacillithiol disulfide reductase [Melioribacteraceae bacterium]